MLKNSDQKQVTVELVTIEELVPENHGSTPNKGAQSRMIKFPTVEGLRAYTKQRGASPIDQISSR
jgi:hypothetical protein